MAGLSASMMMTARAATCARYDCEYWGSGVPMVQSRIAPSGRTIIASAVDQRLELGQHRVQHGLPALGRYSLAVAGQPAVIGPRLTSAGVI
jgi:hypothetical protein